jgi:hypothetical protein
MAATPARAGRYTSLVFGKHCKKADVWPAMGSVGDAGACSRIKSRPGSRVGHRQNPRDNAPDESFIATLECELLERRCFASQVRIASIGPAAGPGTQPAKQEIDRGRHGAAGHASDALPPVIGNAPTAAQVGCAAANRADVPGKVEGQIDPSPARVCAVMDTVNTPGAVGRGGAARRQSRGRSCLGANRARRRSH